MLHASFVSSFFIWFVSWKPNYDASITPSCRPSRCSQYPVLQHTPSAFSSCLRNHVTQAHTAISTSNRRYTFKRLEARFVQSISSHCSYECIATVFSKYFNINTISKGFCSAVFILWSSAEFCRRDWPRDNRSTVCIPLAKALRHWRVFRMKRYKRVKDLL